MKNSLFFNILSESDIKQLKTISLRVINKEIYVSENDSDNDTVNYYLFKNGQYEHIDEDVFWKEKIHTANILHIEELVESDYILINEISMKITTEYLHIIDVTTYSYDFYMIMLGSWNYIVKEIPNTSFEIIDFLKSIHYVVNGSYGIIQCYFDNLLTLIPPFNRDSIIEFSECEIRGNQLNLIIQANQNFNDMDLTRFIYSNKVFYVIEVKRDIIIIFITTENVFIFNLDSSDYYNNVFEKMHVKLFNSENQEILSEFDIRMPSKEEIESFYHENTFDSQFNKDTFSINELRDLMINSMYYLQKDGGK